MDFNFWLIIENLSSAHLKRHLYITVSNTFVMSLYYIQATASVARIIHPSGKELW